MESRPQSPEFRNNPENFTHVLVDFGTGPTLSMIIFNINLQRTIA